MGSIFNEKVTEKWTVHGPTSVMKRGWKVKYIWLLFINSEICPPETRAVVEKEKEKNRIQTNTYKRINFIKCHIKWYNLCHNLFTWRVVSGRSMMVNPWGDIHLLLTTRHRELWYKLCHFVAPTTSITQFHHTSNYDEWKLWNFREKKASKQVRVQMLVSNWILFTYLSNEIYVFAKM